MQCTIIEGRGSIHLNNSLLTARSEILVQPALAPNKSILEGIVVVNHELATT